MHTCDICGEDGLSELDMRTHLLISHFENDLTCPFCCMSGITYDELQFHINTAHCEDSFEAANTNEYSDCTINHKKLSGLELPAVFQEECASTSMEGKNDTSTGTHKELCGTEVKVPSSSTKEMCPVLTETPVLANEHKLKTEIFVSEMGRHFDSPDNELDSKSSPCKSNLNGPVKLKRKFLKSPSKGIQNQEKQYPCPMCSLCCSDVYVLQEHVELHLQERSFTEESSHCSPASTVFKENDNESKHAQTMEHKVDIRKDHKAFSHVVEPQGFSKFDFNKSYDRSNPKKSLISASSSTIFQEDSDAQTTRLYYCPMCTLVCTNSSILQEHVELHLMENGNHTEENGHDQIFARMLQEQEDQFRKAEESKTEAEEFRKLQKQYGLDNSGGFKKQHIQNMEKAVARGQMKPAEYHRRKVELMESLAAGLDDGRTKTSGLIKALYKYYHKEARDVAHVWLCAETDHYHSTDGDKGWGCGYRNFQMLLSALLKLDQYKECVQDKEIPCIPKIQAMIEDAWKEGFDPQGASHFSRRLKDTRAWIGATEMYSLLTFLKIRSRIVDFHCPTGPSGTHPRLFEWVKTFFSLDSSCVEDRWLPKVIQTSRPAIYLQHQGHSRTIVGIEQKNNGAQCLLIFDPGCPSHVMQKLLHPETVGFSLKILRKFGSGLKHKQYQIVAVDGTLTEEERQVQLQHSRILQAERVP
ncbi:zinc finger-containing ubiquitin peptidase 1 isoform X1 [Erpetoichthys calabaricus]|nr:zinc finger-containing ubiquitin peptidase 1 isoform X1 [Erpetoichthys calabaricus]